MEVIGYIAATLIGISLGLIGSGGSILTVPVLVYLFGVRPVDATAFSLFIVGITAAAGAANYARTGLVDFKKALSFAIPSIATVLLMRRVVVPIVPERLGTLGRFVITKDAVIMVVFGALILAASVAMIRDRELSADGAEGASPVRLGWQGFFTGIVTGAVGAGGGFLIIPALVLLARIPMKQAVATSLMIIAMNSLLGFGADINAGHAMNWPLLIGVTGSALLGMVVGVTLSRHVPGKKLKPAFGWFMVAMGLYIIGGQLFGA